MTSGNRPEQTINLSVPHNMRPGDDFVLPHHRGGDHYLVTEVNGRQLTVVRWSWWADFAYPAIWRLTHRRQR